MAKQWTVKLLSSNFGISAMYGDSYFPRSVHYKKDAKTIKASVEKLGGKAVIVDNRNLVRSSKLK